MIAEIVDERKIVQLTKRSRSKQSTMSLFNLEVLNSSKKKKKKRQNP